MDAVDQRKVKAAERTLWSLIERIGYRHKPTTVDVVAWLRTLDDAREQLEAALPKPYEG